MPGQVGKWWSSNPTSTSASGVLTLNDVVWQPFWTGDSVRMAQVQISLPLLADTAGNVVSVAVYADRGDLWPGALVAVLGDLVTTTSAANTSKTLVVNQACTPRSVYWLAYLAKGGTAPTLKVNTGAHPLLGLPDTTFVRTTSAATPYNGLKWTSTGTFPAVAGNETALTPLVQAARLSWSGA